MRRKTKFFIFNNKIRTDGKSFKELCHPAPIYNKSFLSQSFRAVQARQRKSAGMSEIRWNPGDFMFWRHLIILVKAYFEK